MDFSSAFNTNIPNRLLPKLTQLSVPTSVCQWINSFLTDRQQLVRLGKFSSSTRTISTEAPQDCVLSPLLFSLNTDDCTSKDPSVKLLKFADDTTLIGLIQDGDESAYRQEVKELAVWCSLNNLELNTLKTVEMIVDFRRNPPALLKQFYSAIIESILCTSITVWFSSATKSDLRRLRRVVWTAERIIVCNHTLPL